MERRARSGKLSILQGVAFRRGNCSSATLARDHVPIPRNSQDRAGNPSGCSDGQGHLLKTINVVRPAPTRKAQMTATWVRMSGRAIRRRLTFLSKDRAFLGESRDLSWLRTSRRSKRTPRREAPREYQHASRSEHAIGETDSARQKSVPRPIAIGPSRCRVQCCASRAEAGCLGHASLAGLIPRHSHGRRSCNQVDGVDVRIYLAAVEQRQQVTGLTASRCDLRP